MATVKVTITLEQNQLNEIRKLVEAGSTKSVAGFVQHAVKNALVDMAGWRAMLDEALDKTGGSITDKERIWADEIIDGKRKKDSRKKPAA